MKMLKEGLVVALDLEVTIFLNATIITVNMPQSKEIDLAVLKGNLLL